MADLAQAETVLGRRAGLPSPVHSVPGPQDRARQLVMRYGWNATAYQILNPGMLDWFSPDGNAVVGFVQYHQVRVVAGAPVCAEERLPAGTLVFERGQRRVGHRGREVRESLRLALVGVGRIVRKGRRFAHDLYNALKMRRAP